MTNSLSGVVLSKRHTQVIVTENPWSHPPTDEGTSEPNSYTHDKKFNRYIFLCVLEWICHKTLVNILNICSNTSHPFVYSHSLFSQGGKTEFSWFHNLDRSKTHIHRSPLFLPFNGSLSYIDVPLISGFCTRILHVGLFVSNRLLR